MGESDPEAAKPIIEKEFLFFIAADLEKLEEEFGAVPFNEVSELCLKRGASIDRDFNWKKVCEHTYSYGDDLKAKNELFYRLIQDEITTQEERIEQEDNCAGLGKKLQRTSAGELCMSDYEYAAFEQRQSENAANERFRLQLEKDREAERKRRALKDFTDSMNKLNESMQPQQQVIIQQPLLQPVQPPRVINCYSNTYGHYTSTSCY